MAEGSSSLGEGRVEEELAGDQLDEFDPEVHIWAQQFGLSQNSLQKLQKEGYVTLMLLSSLDKKSIPLLGLRPNAQSSTLNMAVRYLNDCKTFVQKSGPNGNPVFLPAVVLPISKPVDAEMGASTATSNDTDLLSSNNGQGGSIPSLPDHQEGTSSAGADQRTHTESGNEGIGLALNHVTNPGGLSFNQGQGQNPWSIANLPTEIGTNANLVPEPAVQPGVPSNPTSHGYSQPQAGVSAEALLSPNYLLEVHKTSKALHILDFVTLLMAARDSQDSVIATNEEEDIQVFARRGSSKRTLLSDVTPVMWAQANARIQHALIKTKVLEKTQDIQDYSTYTAYITKLGQIYDWQDVLIFDDEYRVAQDFEKFRWGADCGFLRAIYLEGNKLGKSQNSGASKKGVQNKEGAQRPNKNKRKGGQICHNFNFNTCRYGDSCKFRHVCLARGCYGNHKATQHESQEGK